MSSKRLEVKDPVFAAYLISRGCELLMIEPYCRATTNPYRPPRPKKYIFDESVKDSSLEAEFLGANGPKARTTWLDFKNGIDNLQAREDHVLRQSSRRIDRHGKEHWPGMSVFVTSSQSVAAFLLSRNLQITHVSELRRGSSYLFAFLEKEKAHMLYMEMLNRSTEDSWYKMKMMYKFATSLRLHFCDHRRMSLDSQYHANG